MNTRISELREALGMNQTQFADSIGVSRNFICIAEKGDRNLSDRTISDICRIHGISEDWLRTGEGEMFVPITREKEIAQIAKKIFNNEIPDEVQALIHVLADMDDTESKMFVKFVEKYTKKLDEIEKDLPE